MALSRLISRPLLASYFGVAGVDSIRNAAAIAPQAAPVTERLAPLAQQAVDKSGRHVTVPRDPVTWVRVNGALQVVAAAALATGRMPRLASGVLAATLVPSTAARCRFWEATDKQERADQRTQFFKNAALLGGLLIAARDTEGRPGLAWRARHAAHDVRREAQHLARDARREAKLLKSELT